MYDADRITDFLTKVPLFHSMNKRQLQKLARRFVARDYAAGQAIVTQGKGGEGMFIIASGKAEAMRERVDGTKVVVNSFGPTDFFGEMALLSEGARTASVVATEDSHCLVLSRWDFLATMKEDADMGVAISQELARRFRMALDVL